MSEGKGVLLFSGGLDSILAAKLLMEQNIQLSGLHFLLPFSPPDLAKEDIQAFQIAESINMPLSIYRCEMEYMEIIKNPAHGYGKNINPCIDCKIYFLKKAKKKMLDEGASFVATGEVVGQRPMSQFKNMLIHIEKASELKGYLLRPLSAKLFEPTIAEANGIVIRERLLDINGRSRKIQLELAEKYNITGYSAPAGGCQFTDPNVSKRVKDLLENHPDYNMIDVYLLTIGRHFRVNRAKIIVARNHTENIELEKYMDSSDYFIIPEFKGPLLYIKGLLKKDEMKIIGSIALRYKNKSDTGNRILIHSKRDETRSVLINSPASESLLKEYMI